MFLNEVINMSCKNLLKFLLNFSLIQPTRFDTILLSLSEWTSSVTVKLNYILVFFV